MVNMMICQKAHSTWLVPIDEAVQKAKEMQEKGNNPWRNLCPTDHTPDAVVFEGQSTFL